MASVAKEYEARGVYFAALSTWDDDKAKVDRWLSGLRVSGIRTGNATRGGFEKAHKLAGQEAKGIPSTVYISADGVIRDIHIGCAGEDDIRTGFDLITSPA